ncbi:hypothetical protein QQ008_28790 [Fulvivirgaceae bacterium BMA10]|uniref:SGNH/GDSL hydrolase family protein n=1 Tax=Splendidivirga corallicola TaxID=3051826 RepID=A0ABT8KX93_9BACT|nr:hypothetical protein [Fulvivirgaceae bacterium BMA10]
MSFLARVKANLLLFIISVTFSLILAEIIVRIFVEQETKRLAIYDKELGWRGRPNGSGTYIRNKDSIKVPFRYNNYGFRDDDVDENNESNNIMFLGDSFIESLEVEYEYIFHERLENKLKEIDPKNEVVAVGSQGYSTAQEILAFNRYKSLLNPKTVLLAFYTGNDFSDNTRKNFAYLDNNEKLIFPENKDSWAKVQFLTFKRWLYEQSHLVFYLKNFVESRANVRFDGGTKKESATSNQYPFRITKSLILKLKEDVKEYGANFGIVIIPWKRELLNKDFEKIDFVKNICAEAQIPVLDLSEHLTLEDYFDFDVHFTREGHGVVADAIYEFLNRDL